MYFDIDITQQWKKYLLVLGMSKKHTSLDVFPQKSTAALPTFEQSPLATLWTFDCLICKFK